MGTMKPQVDMFLSLAVDYDPNTRHIEVWKGMTRMIDGYVYETRDHLNQAEADLKLARQQRKESQEMTLKLTRHLRKVYASMKMSDSMVEAILAEVAREEY